MQGHDETEKQHEVQSSKCWQQEAPIKSNPAVNRPELEQAACLEVCVWACVLVWRTCVCFRVSMSPALPACNTHTHRVPDCVCFSRATFTELYKIVEIKHCTGFSKLIGQCSAALAVMPHSGACHYRKIFNFTVVTVTTIYSSEDSLGI